VICDWKGCDDVVMWLAYASYPATDGVHPLHARYPAPSFRACNGHLGMLFAVDLRSRLSTAEWVVMQAPTTTEESA
jgi:hypothetical protein